MKLEFISPVGTSYWIPSVTDVECWVKVEVPVIVTVYDRTGPLPLLPPPQAVSSSNPTNITPPARLHASFLFRRVPETPMPTKPIIGAKGQANGASANAAKLAALMVSVAVALPFGPGVMELGFREQVGAPEPVGCTEQDSVTGLSKAFINLTLTVAEELAPRERVAGIGFEAAIEKSVPLLSSTLILSSLLMVTRSGALSLFRSATVARPRPELTAKLIAGWKVPSPFPGNTSICPWIRCGAPAISSLASPS